MMPKKSEALLSTDREVASAMRPPAGRLVAEYRVAGTPNLVLRVTASGHRAWCYWLKRPKTGRWSKYSIGPYPTVKLARAREEAVRLRLSVIDRLLDKGIAHSSYCQQPMRPAQQALPIMQKPGTIDSIE
jgi:Arm DNA-binding domain